MSAPLSSPSRTGTGVSSALPGARQALAFLLVINLLNYIDRYILASAVGPIKATLLGPEGSGVGPWLQPVVDWCQHSLHFKPQDALMGLLSTAFMVVYMVAAPVFARLAERRNRWVLIGVGVILWSLASGASGLATTFVVLLITRCFVGIGEAAYGPVAPALLADFYPVERRGRILSWFYIALPVGSALGYMLGDVLSKPRIPGYQVHWLGLTAEGWRWAFFLVVLPGVVLGALAFLFREPPRGRSDLAESVPPRPATRRDYLVLLRTPSYVFCTLGMTAMTFAMGGIAFWMPYYLEGLPGSPAASATIFGGITAAAGISGTLLGGLLGDKLRARFGGAYFLVSAGAMVVGFPFFLAVLALPDPFPWIWVLIFLTCFCLFFNTGPTNTILANVSHPAVRSAAYALNILVIHALGDAISPFVIGILSDRFSLRIGFGVVGIMFLVAAFFWYLGSRHLERDTRLAPTRLAVSPPTS